MTLFKTLLQHTCNGCGYPFPRWNLHKANGKSYCPPCWQSFLDRQKRLEPCEGCGDRIIGPIIPTDGKKYCSNCLIAYLKKKYGYS